ncbi:T9SS type A sorting domain-containing protein [Marixanthomonas spongiae]|nr:T9SS type A sorting domain-containing protein [Marixanthomonas spongiae]
MKHLLLSLLTLYSVAATAQSDLFVRPNPSSNTDSYVYVNNVELYVENDIDLRKNNTDTTEASIYLRNNGQLIQGDDTAQNKGDGMLSVYQTIAETSAFHYNYWGMPVGATLTSAGSTLPAGNTASSVFTVYNCEGCNPDDTAGTKTLTTTGRNGFLNPDLTISTRWVYELQPSKDREDEGAWRRLNGTATSNPAYGFIMKGISPNPITGNTGDPNIDGMTDVTYDLRGRPKNGKISINMAAGDEIVLAGNPYPSVLDLHKLASDNQTGGANIASFRFWDEPKDDEFSHYYSDKSGAYGVYVPNPPGGGVYNISSFNNYSASGTGGPSGTGSTTEYRKQQFTPIGQGFIIVTDGTAGTIEFNNSQRVFGLKAATEVFHRPGNDNNITMDGGPDTNPGDPDGSVLAEVDPRAPHLRIDVVMEEKYGRQLVLGFDDSTSLGFDLGWDGKSPMDAKNGEAYFLIGEDDNREPYVINFLNYDKQTMIPIGFNLTKQTKLLVQTVEEVKMSGKKAYIYDKELDTYQGFTHGKSATYNLQAGTYDNRFFVVFRTDKELDAYTTKTQGRAQQDVDFFQNNRLGVLEVTNPEGYDIAQALVFDLTGKLVYQQQNIGTEKRFSFPTSNLSDGVYIVKLKTTDNIDISYKTSVYNKQ